ncbi:hypothetical protein LR48_Vigan511s009900 [Vigna angularis]|uniref:Uncharacterized protein n=1 Tax=Phaseolus angularis TaxID=3914 RepID=A0A0L9TD02_PHAAN|nr:hypothetical protein LR48_Vigan511s009900 [Vigna angularis]
MNNYHSLDQALQAKCDLKEELGTLKAKVLEVEVEVDTKAKVMIKITMKTIEKKLVSRSGMIEDKVEPRKVAQEWSALNRPELELCLGFMMAQRSRVEHKENSTTLQTSKKSSVRTTSRRWSSTTVLNDKKNSTTLLSSIESRGITGEFSRELGRVCRELDNELGGEPKSSVEQVEILAEYGDS